MTDRDAINRRLMKWLGGNFEPCDYVKGYGHVGMGWVFPWTPEGKAEKPLDFFLDESASAQLLEKMPLGTRLINGRNWMVSDKDNHLLARDPDRKTCIALAADKIIGGNQ